MSDEFDDEGHEEEDDEYSNCGQFFDEQGPGGVLVCGKVGSEECDWECPHSSELGQAWESFPSPEEDE